MLKNPSLPGLESSVPSARKVGICKIKEDCITALWFDLILKLSGSRQTNLVDFTYRIYANKMKAINGRKFNSWHFYDSNCVQARCSAVIESFLELCSICNDLESYRQVGI